MHRWILALFVVATIGVAAFGQDSDDASNDTPKDADNAREDKKDDKKETVDELLKRVEEAHKEHDDFKGNFDQTKYLPLFGDKIESHGKFVFKKPDHVRWEYTKPNKSILVVTGETGKKWSEGTARVENFKLGDDRGLDAVVKQLFTWFKGEFTKLKDDYKVEIESRAPIELKMTPKKDVVKKFIHSIVVKFSDDDDEIASVKILEPKQKGDTEHAYTLYEFKDTELDSGVKDSEFEIDK